MTARDTPTPPRIQDLEREHEWKQSATGGRRLQTVIP
jgi:hypothetical protein